jgi:hypothetical protein
MEEAFSPINWTLLITGCRIYPSKYRFFNFLDSMQAIMLIACHIIHSAIQLLKFPEEATKFYIIEKTKTVLLQFSGILFIVIMRRNRKKIHSLFEHVKGSLTPKDLRYLYWYALSLSIPHWIFLVGMLVALAQFLRDEHTKAWELFSILYTVFNSWIFGGCPAFMFCLVALDVCEKNAMVQILQNFSQKTIELDPSDVSLFLKKIISNRNYMMQYFSCLPCSWYLFVFVKSVVTYILLQLQEEVEQKGSHHNLYSTIMMIEWISVVLLLVYVMLKTESILTKSNDRLEVLSEKVILRNDTETWIQVLNDIRQAEKFEYRAWDIFSMNKSFFVSFISSLLTFTILCIQLFGPAIAPK